MVSNNSPILHSNIPVTFHEYPALLSLDAGHQLHPAMAQLEENNVLIAPTNPIETTNDNNLYSGGFQDNTVVDQLVQPGSEEFIYQHSLARNRQASNSANHDAALTSFLAGMDHAINPRTLTGNTTEPGAQEYYQAQAIGEENASFHLSVPAGIPQGFEVQYLPGLIEPQMLQFDHSVQSGMQQRFNGQYLPGPIEPQWSQFDHSVQSAMQPGFNLQSFPGTIDPNVSQFDHSVPSDTQQGFNFQSLPGTINPNLLQFDHAMQLMAQEALQILPSVETIDHQYTTTTAGHEAELPDLFDNEGPEGYEENDEDDEDDEDDEYEEYEEDGEHEEYEEQEGYLYQY